MHQPLQPSARPLTSRRVRHVLGTLFFASLVCTGLWAFRAYWAHKTHFSGLVGNLGLAWIPLPLALLLCYRKQADVKFWALGITWLLFFPNSFYIVTDLIHVKKFGSDKVAIWYDALMTAAFACV